MTCSGLNLRKKAAQPCVERRPPLRFQPSCLACEGVSDSSASCQRGRVGAAHTNRYAPILAVCSSPSGAALSLFLVVNPSRARYLEMFLTRLCRPASTCVGSPTTTGLHHCKAFCPDFWLCVGAGAANQRLGLLKKKKKARIQLTGGQTVP